MGRERNRMLARYERLNMTDKQVKADAAELARIQAMTNEEFDDYKLRKLTEMRRVDFRHKGKGAVLRSMGVMPPSKGGNTLTETDK